MTNGPTCPGCDESIFESFEVCNHCGFPLEKYSALDFSVRETQASRPRPAIEIQNAGAVIRLDSDTSSERQTSLANQAVWVIGSSDQPSGEIGNQVWVHHPSVGSRHAAVFFGKETDQSSGCYWIVNLAPGASGSFINGRSFQCMRLRDGAIVQLGVLAWRFSLARKQLVPVTPILGFDLDVDAEVAGRLLRTKLLIRRGQMTALVGPSGCGKSTLLETIRDGSGLQAQVDPSGLVYFVPQADLVHHDLRLGDALRSIGKLYGRDVLPFEIDAALDAVGLSPADMAKFPKQLSGGQLRRFRIAGAILSGAGVIVLDEPDSGLDYETADEIISLLRSLAVRGATIVAVTHHRHVLELFDRVINMHSTPEGGAVDASQTIDQSDLAEVKAEPPQMTWLGRLPILLNRERKKITSPRLVTSPGGWIGVPSCVLAIVLVPLLFAVAIAISVPTDPNRDVADGLYGKMAPIARLGFLSIVSVIWMSASGSHLTITRDRELSDYERSHGPTWGGLLIAKGVMYSLVGILQTLVFCILLYLVRSMWLSRSFFVDERITQMVGVIACLICVSVAATLLGILISSLAGRVPLIATAILPVVMMIQILFSAPFSVSNPDGYEPLADYKRFSVVTSDQADGSPDDRLDDDWSGDDWSEDGWSEDGWSEDGWSEDGWQEDSGIDRPLWITSLLSYATLSRYGDQWLRSFAVTTDPPEQAGLVQRRSAFGLVVISALSLFGSWLVLSLQTTRLGIRRAVVAGAVALAMTSGTQTASARQTDRTDTQIQIPIIDGRYDENKVRAALGGHVDDAPKLRRFDQQDRLGLVTLELLGKIEFSLSDDQMTITLKSSPNWDLMKQLAPPRLLGVGEAIGRSDVILFVHGLEGGAATFAAAERELKRRGIATMRFDYPNDGPPVEIAESLVQQFREFARDSPSTRIHIVAHSLGGLIATWAVTDADMPAGQVGNVFTLGTPFRGSALAEFHDELELFDVAMRLGKLDLRALDTIRDGRGEAARAIRPDSEFLRRLHARPRPAGIAFHLAAGTKGFLTGQRQDLLVAQLPAELVRLSVSAEFADQAGRLLRARELRRGLGDGAVTTESALGLANPAGTTTFPLAHTALVVDLAPLEWVLQTAQIDEPRKATAK